MAANKYDELDRLGDLLNKGIITQEEFDQKKAEILARDNEPTTQYLSKLKTPAKQSSKPLSEQLAPLLAWAKTNQKYLLYGCGALVIGWVIFKFFIQANPQKEGQTVAKQECECQSESNKGFIAAYQTFLGELDAKKFKTRQEAEASLQTQINDKTQAAIGCAEKAKKTYNEGKEKYLLDYDNLNQFERGYSAQKEICTPEKATEQTQLANTVMESMNRAFKQQELVIAHSGEMPVTMDNNNTNNQYLYITGERVNLRSQPNTSANVVGQMSFETPVTNLGETSSDARGVTWYKVSYNGTEGWVSNKFTSNNQFFRQTWKKATVQDPDGYTNVRETPNIASAVLTQAKVGDRFTVIENLGNWSLVILKDETRGYIFSDRVVY